MGNRSGRGLSLSARTVPGATTSRAPTTDADRRPKRGLVLPFAPLLVLVAACSTTPIILHEGLPAYAPPCGPPESRFGYQRVFQFDKGGFRPGDCFNLGTRFGQRWRGFTFQEGLMMNGGANSANLGLQAGVGLEHPQVTAYGTWLPLGIAGQSNNRVQVQFEPDCWWQASLLFGLPHRPHGLGWTAGVRASRQGVGPVCLGEFGSGVLSVRGELSVEFLSPWYHGPKTGVYASLGISTAWHPRLQ